MYVNPLDDVGAKPKTFSNDAEIESSDYFPSASYSKSWNEDLKLTISASQTTARPNFRELAFTQTTDRVKGTIFKGNPDLKPSEIRNYDARFDWNLSESEILSLSLFYKEIKDPIQQAKGNKKMQEVGLPYSQNETTFINSNSAEIYGIEIEAKKSLDILHDTLRGFKLGANLTWSDSKLAISDVESAIWGEVGSSDWLDKNADNRLTRSLEGQSEWIFNIDFSYTNEDWGTVATLVYSFYDERLKSASYLTIDDVWEDSYDSLNFILSQNFGESQDWKVKFAAKNLTTPDRIERIYGTETLVSRYNTGQSYSLSVSKSF